MKKQTYKGNLNTTFRWIIPIILGISTNNIDEKVIIYAIHITPFIEFGINFKKKSKKVL
jgi:hypothetical protein